MIVSDNIWKLFSREDYNLKHLFFFTIIMILIGGCEPKKESEVDSENENKYLALVQEQVDAYNAHDLERFIACYSEDVVIEDAQGDTMMKGQDQMRKLYEELFSANPNIHCEIISRFKVGEYVIDEEHITGFDMEGYPTKVRGAAIYNIVNGKIVHVRLIM